jgi:hypothetical protein
MICSFTFSSRLRSSITARMNPAGICCASLSSINLRSSVSAVSFWIGSLGGSGAS